MVATVDGPTAPLNIVSRLREEPALLPSADAQRASQERTRLAPFLLLLGRHSSIGKCLHFAFPRCKNDGAHER